MNLDRDAVVSSDDELSNILGTNGHSIFFPVPSSDGKIVANLARRIVIALEDEEAIDKKITYGDLLFLIRSLVQYAHNDANVVASMGSTTLFFSDKPDSRPQSKLIADMREVARKFSETIDILDAMPTALVEKDEE